MIISHQTIKSKCNATCNQGRGLGRLREGVFSVPQQVFCKRAHSMAYHHEYKHCLDMLGLSVDECKKRASTAGRKRMEEVRDQKTAGVQKTLTLTSLCTPSPMRNQAKI